MQANKSYDGYILPSFDPYKEFTALQWTQFYDKYSKTKGDGTKETWVETIARATNFLRELSNDKLDEEIYQKIFKYLYTGDVSPSMRLFQMAGDAARRDSSVLYNCSYLLIDSLISVAETMYLSMSGTGVGFSVEWKNVSKLPVVGLNQGYSSFWDVEDTQKGWYDATLYLLQELWEGNDVYFNYSKLRPAGAPLSTKGGFSSGPQVLIDVHNGLRRIIKNAQGRKLTTVEAFDITTLVANAGISGGVRRCATIALFDYDDEGMHKVKYDGFYNVPEHSHRSNANISAVWPEWVSREQVDYLTHNLFSTGTGEPGIFSRSAALKSSPERRSFEFPEYVGTNPCIPDFGTVLTPEGIKTFADIDIGSTIWSENGWVKVTDKWSNGIKSVNAYHTLSGVFVGTANHRIVQNKKKVEVQNATFIDRLKAPKDSAGTFVVGDTQYELFDGYVYRYDGNLGTTVYPDSTIDSIEYLGEFEVFDITVDGENHTFWSGGLNVSNCGEVILKAGPSDSDLAGGQFCNLSSIQPREGESLETLLEKAEIATIIGDIQSLSTNFPVLRPGWKKITENDRLLGVNLISHANTPSIRNAKVLQAVRDKVIQTDRWFAKQFDVPVSAATTSVKPSGNSSTLYGCAPGVNPVHGVSQIRNVKINVKNPMFLFLDAQGVPNKPYPGYEGKEQAFSFPVKYLSDSITLDNTTALEQLEYWKLVRNNYTEHNCSVTIQFEYDEVEAIKDWLYENQEHAVGIALYPSFKGNSAYGILPIEVVSEEELRVFESNFPKKISWENFASYQNIFQDMTPECAGGECFV